MRVVLFTPYETLRPESLTLFHCARFLGGKKGIKKLLCNGIFSACARDMIYPHAIRPLDACSTCFTEQLRRAKEGEYETIELSSYLSVDDVTNLRRASKEGTERIAKDFLTSDLVDAIHRTQVLLDDSEELIKKLYLSTARMVQASRRFLRETRPDLLLIGWGEDILTFTLLHEARQQGFPWQLWRVEEKKAVEEGAEQSQIIIGVSNKGEAVELPWRGEKGASNVAREMIEAMGLSPQQLSLHFPSKSVGF